MRMQAGLCRGILDCNGPWEEIPQAHESHSRMGPFGPLAALPSRQTSFWVSEIVSL